MNEFKISKELTLPLVYKPDQRTKLNNKTKTTMKLQILATAAAIANAAMELRICEDLAKIDRKCTPRALVG